jgi:hypothetical protein
VKEDRMPKKIFTQELEESETKENTQERMERGSTKRYSSAGSEKMERVSDRSEKMGRQCSTGQRPQWAVEPMEEEE